jgi:hypothetical protein
VKLCNTLINIPLLFKSAISLFFLYSLSSVTEVPSSGTVLTIQYLQYGELILLDSKKNSNIGKFSYSIILSLIGYYKLLLPDIAIRVECSFTHH